MQGECVETATAERTRRVYDLREYAVTSAPHLGAKSPGVSLRGWMVQIKIRASGGGLTLMICITAPGEVVLDFATDVPRGVTSARNALMMSFSADVELMYRADTSNAEKDRCINTLTRVADAATGLPPGAYGNLVRHVIDCAMHDIDPEQARTFRLALGEATSNLAARDNYPEHHRSVETILLAAFMKAGWTPLDVAELHRATSASGRDLITPVWVRSTATRTTSAEKLLDWTTGRNLLNIRPQEMALARRYRTAGWSFEHVQEMTCIENGSGLGGSWGSHMVKLWYHLPPMLAIGAARAGLGASEARTLFDQGDLSQDSLAMLAALRPAVSSPKR